MDRHQTDNGSEQQAQIVFYRQLDGRITQ